MFGIPKRLSCSIIFAFVIGFGQNVQAQIVDGLPIRGPERIIDVPNNVNSDLDVLTAFNPWVGSPESVRMSKIQKKIDAAEMDVPDDVLREIEEIFIQIRAQFEIGRALEDEHLVPAFEGLTEEEYYEKEWPIWNAYHDSAPFKAYEQKLHKLYKQNQDLIRPYIYPYEPSKIDRYNLTGEEKDQHYLDELKAKYNIPHAELLVLEGLLMERRENELKFREMRRNYGWPEVLGADEYKELEAEKKETWDEVIRIVAPYKDAARKKRRLREKLREDFLPPRRDPTPKELYADEFDRLVHLFELYNVTMSERDVLALKTLFKEMVELEESSRIGRTYEPDTIEAHNINVQFEAFKARKREILNPYEEQVRDEERRGVNLWARSERRAKSYIYELWER